jgi:hypothetical protein
MTKLIKILHIDPNWKVVYFLIHGRALVKTVVSLKTTLSLLACHKFDLILSEPQNIAIMDPQATFDENILERLPFWQKIGSDLREMAVCPS